MGDLDEVFDHQSSIEPEPEAVLTYRSDLQLEEIEKKDFDELFGEGKSIDVKAEAEEENLLEGLQEHIERELFQEV